MKVELMAYQSIDDVLKSYRMKYTILAKFLGLVLRF
jgi:hypothetical protein